MRIAEEKPGVVSLIAATDEEDVPTAVPYDALPLASLRTDEVHAWLEENRNHRIYVMAGAEFASEGVPTLTVPVTAADYGLVVAAMPR